MHTPMPIMSQKTMLIKYMICVFHCLVLFKTSGPIIGLDLYLYAFKAKQNIPITAYFSTTKHVKPA